MTEKKPAKKKPKSVVAKIDGAVVVSGHAVIYKTSTLGKYVVIINSDSIKEKGK